MAHHTQIKCLYKRSFRTKFRRIILFIKADVKIEINLKTKLQ